jgi:hypothetical protein
MGLVRELLAEINLPDREVHNSRMFVDLCENIHIHYREIRIVFSLDEYFEFVDILQKSTADVRNFLAQNPDYKEGVYPTTVMVAGGPGRQRKLLENSPAANKSTYFPNHFAIELQDESVIDEIHVHWRDYRIALNRDHFRRIAQAFADAERKLTAFESSHLYLRKEHPDRTMQSYALERAKYAEEQTRIQGEIDVPLAMIRTKDPDFLATYQPDSAAIAELLDRLSGG